MKQKETFGTTNTYAYDLDIAVIGGGAAGLSAAIAAGRALPDGAKLAVLDAQPRCGRKLLATGNGRCNLTNRTAGPADYHTDDPRAVSRVFSGVNVDDTLAFFESLGLVWREEEEGRIYPACGQASAVLDLLRLELMRLGAAEVCGCRVERISPQEDGFVLRSPLGAIHTKQVIVACGGMAAPQLGGVNWGYDLLRPLGHTATKLCPSLSPLPVDSPHLGSLKGIRAHVKAAVGDSRGEIASDEGEVQFGDKALSGIVIFQLSSEAAGVTHGKDLCVTLDMLPERNQNGIVALLIKRRAILPHLTLENYLTGVFNKRVGMCLLKQAGLTPLSRSVSELSDGDIRRLAGIIKSWRFPVSGTAAWNSAQVTSGGVRLSEFDGMTMQSRLQPGLYAAGELLNADGRCGGFNLQWAWSSGILAGRSAAESHARSGR
ncbi:MAG: aminoacetone oxidase family FAD-binding enzyme [Clostridia bacterium]|nr:aminoacetone oxidase family FAD-binding enzyme [Clostridia bacterium]